MFPSIHSLTLLPLALIALVSAQYPDELVGTWVTKARTVVTGPEFYDPVADKFIEPKHTGYAYSFTSDGYFEQAYYRSVPNPTTPKCPSGLMQWQHGTYSLPGNGSIILDPFAIDGRQLISSPCTYETSILTLFDPGSTLLKTYQASTDGFHNVPRLDLFGFDGAPLQPLYLAFKPPQMLPTQTLNPTAASEPTSKVKRDMDRDEHDRWRQKMIKGGSFEHDGLETRPMRWDPERWWWAGFGFLAVGTVMYMLPTKL